RDDAAATHQHETLPPKVKYENTTKWLIPNLLGEVQPRQLPSIPRSKPKRGAVVGPQSSCPNACSGDPLGSGGVFGDLVNPAVTDSFVCSGLVSALRSIHIRAVFTTDWHFARILAGLRAG